MTVVAGHITMRAIQGKIRGEVVIEVCVIPRPCVVAGAAILAPVAVMSVVLKVAADAGDVHAVTERIFAVTVAAGQRRMAKFQREAGIAVVIKARILPRTRVMAVLALFATAPLVEIVFRMATEAVCRCVLVCLVDMTVRTGRLDMFAEQRPAGGLVIELGRQPVDRAVTISARFTEKALVNVVLAMTVDTLVRCIAVLVAGLMTAVTISFGVLALEHKVSQPVVEARFIKNDDLRISAFMFRMAGSTAILCYLAVTSVIALLGRHIICHVLVTVEAELSLPGTVE